MSTVLPSYPPLKAFEDLSKKLLPYLYPSPLRRYTHLEKALNAPFKIWLKCENQQNTGSFKLRSAFGALHALSKEEKQKGVASRSSGNFGHALAYLCHELKLPCHIVLPTHCSALKVSHTQRYTPHVHRVGHSHVESQHYVDALCQRIPLTPLAPYNYWGSLLGNGSLVLEILDQALSFQSLFLPVGGGSLAAGVGVVLKYLLPKSHLFCVEPTEANDFFTSFYSHCLRAKDGSQTLADGLRTPQVGELEFSLLQQVVKDCVCVEDSLICQAMALLYRDLQLITEPSGATALAGFIQAYKNGRLPPGDVVIILTGGNIEKKEFFSLIKKERV